MNMPFRYNCSSDFFYTADHYTWARGPLLIMGNYWQSGNSGLGCTATHVGGISSNSGSRLTHQYIRFFILESSYNLHY